MLEALLLTTRVAVGIFFAISGYHKLTNMRRKVQLRRTFRENGIPFVAFNMIWVPLVELAAGAALVMGMMFPLPILGLLSICCVAFITDGIRRIRSWKPINKADWLDDVLYLPEVLYIVLLVQLLLLGYGSHAVGLATL